MSEKRIKKGIMIRNSSFRTVSLIIVFLFLFFCIEITETLAEEYVAVHTKEELSKLFSQVKGYLDENGETVLRSLDDSKNHIVTQSLIRSWAIIQYGDPAARQIDDAYDSLFNMSVFVKLAVGPDISVPDGLLLDYAVRILDEEYFGLLAESGENTDNIKYAEYLCAAANQLSNNMESFTSDEVKELIIEIRQETLVAAGLKAITHTEMLPKPDELFENGKEAVLIPNPKVKYDTSESLKKILGIQMPELTEDFGAQLGYYSIIADIVSEIEYEFPDNSKLIFRISPDLSADISGVYGASFFETREIAETQVNIYKFQSILIASGIVKTQDEKAFNFAVVSEGLTEVFFQRVTDFFIRGCRFQKFQK